jgi:outer membrane protein TolC
MSIVLRSRLVSVALAVLCGGASLEGQVDTLVVGLQDAERIALEHSPLLESAIASVELARAQEDLASGARFLPELRLRNVWGPAPKARGEFTEFGVLVSPDTATTGFGDLTWFTQVDVNLVQPIYTFGKLGSRIEAARFQVDANRAELERTRADLLKQVRQLYWGIVLSNELVDVSSSVRERVDEAETRLMELYDEGEASQNDLFKFELFKYEVTSQSREVETGRTKAVAAMRALLGLGEDVVLEVATGSLEELDVEVGELADYLDAARGSRPEITRLEAGLNARRALVRGLEADRKPTLYAAGQFSLNRSPGRFDPSNPWVRNPTNFTRPAMLLGIDWNLNFWQSGDRTEVERFELARLEAQARPLRLMIDQQVREAYLELVRAEEDVEDGRSALRASENLLRAELQTFDLGIGNIDDVIDAFKSNVGMSVTQLRNLARYNTKLAELSQSVGRDLQN